MTRTRLSHDGLIQMLQKIQGKRTQKEFAESLGVSQQYICDLYAGKRQIGDKVLRALGMTREWSYYSNKDI